MRKKDIQGWGKSVCLVIQILQETRPETGALKDSAIKSFGLYVRSQLQLACILLDLRVSPLGQGHDPAGRSDWGSCGIGKFIEARPSLTIYLGRESDGRGWRGAYRGGED
jgi:hypothetical protein